MLSTLYSFLLIFLIFACFITSYHMIHALVVPFNKKKYAPFVPTPSPALTAISEVINLKTGETFCDLGSGDGKILIHLSRTTSASGTGYERSIVLCWLTKIKIFLFRAPAKIFRKNIFSVDLNSFDAVFCYLTPRIMAELEPIFDQKMKSGSRLVSYTFPLPTRQPTKVTNIKVNFLETSRVYLYEF